MEKRKGILRILYATKYSIEGLLYGLKKEAAFRQIFLLNIILIIFSLIFFRENIACLILIILSILSIVVEAINTAIEAIVDRISLDYHPLSKVAKDMGSLAQFLMLVIIIFSWIFISVKY